jgi:hypothetical protein
MVLAPYMVLCYLEAPNMVLPLDSEGTMSMRPIIPERNLEAVRVRVLPDGRLTRKDAALYLGVNPKTLAMWAMQGKGPPIRRVGGRCFYTIDDLDDFIQSAGE